MRKYFISTLLIGFVLCFGYVNSFAQSKSELQQRKKKLQEEIQYTNSLLKKTAKTKSASVNQLRQINKQISSREELISTIEEEINFFDDSLETLNLKIDTLRDNISVLKAEYAEMIKSAYDNRSAYDRFMFLFSAANFNQAFKRLKYFQEYAQYRQSQAAKIQEKQKEIDAKISLLEALKKSKQGLLNMKLNERNKLANQKQQKESVVASLKGKEKQLKKNLQEKEKAAQQITKAIEKIIAEEIRKAREAAKKAGKSEKGFPMTPEAIELSNSFAANKGKLPWPVAEGVITAQYGEHPHPTLKGVTVQNNGIDISTKKENMGRAIFDGSVSRVIIIPGEGKVVMVRHGEYFTVYFYFKEVFVSAGDKVNTKQNLGVLMAEANENASIMHLEIWKVTNKMNPEKWIYKTNSK